MTEPGGQPAAASASGQQPAPATPPAAPAMPPAGGTATGSSPPAAPAAPAGEGHQTVHWFESLEPDTFNERDSTILKRFGSVPELAKGYVNAFNLVGRDKIPIPTNEQEFQSVYDRLGRPETHEGYELTINSEYAPEFHEMMKGNQDWFKQTAYKLGLNKTQASELYKEYTDLAYTQQRAQQDRVQGEMVQASNTLKNEFGEAFNAKMVLANRAIDELGGEPLVKILEESGLGRHPTVVKAFIKMGEMLGEEAGIDLGGEGGEANADLDSQIAEIQADPAYLDAKNPQHQVLVAKMQKLMMKRHPEEQMPAGTIRLF